MSIDEFGQFNRKKSSQKRKTSTSERSSGLSEADIQPDLFSTLKEYFSLRNRFEILRLVFFIIYWICAFAVLFVIWGKMIETTWADTNEGSSIGEILVICILILVQIVIFSSLLLACFYFCWRYFLWLARSLDDAIYGADNRQMVWILVSLSIVSFSLVIGIACYACGLIRLDFYEKSEAESQDVLIDSTWYSCISQTKIYGDVDYKWNAQTIRKKDKVLAFASKTDYFKALSGDRVGYIQKDFLRPIQDTLSNISQLDKRKYYAKDYYSRSESINRYSDGTVEEVFENSDIYRGDVNSKEERNGTGTYFWISTRVVDSLYIGQWKGDTRNGYGVFYDFKNKISKRGVWMDDVLITSYGEYDKKQLRSKVDSVFFTISSNHQSHRSHTLDMLK